MDARVCGDSDWAYTGGAQLPELLPRKVGEHGLPRRAQAVRKVNGGAHGDELDGARSPVVCALRDSHADDGVGLGGLGFLQQAAEC